VLIVGGGCAGLSAAWRLRGAGVERFLVCEVEREVGGTARSGRHSSTAYPWGAHYLPAPLRNTGPVPRLLDEMGVITGVDDSGKPIFAEHVLIHEPEERLFYRGEWYEGLYLRAGASADDLAELGRFEGLVRSLANARDARGRRAFAVPLEVGSDDAEWTQLDRITMADWLDREDFHSKRLRWLVDYACRDDYGAMASEVSAWAGLWYFCSRRSEDGENEGFLSWPEGNGRLVAQLARSVGAERLESSVLIHSLERENDQWVAHGLDSVSRAPLRFEARQVILAVPRFVAVRLVAQWRLSPPRFAEAFTYSPWVVANIFLNDTPWSRGFPIAWDNVLYDSKSLGYVVASHQGARASDWGPAVWTWYYPLVGADPRAERRKLLATTPADWQHLVQADLLPAHPNLPDQVERIDVKRWGHGMIRPVPGFLWGAARREAKASLHGTLHFAHSDLGGLGLFEEANWQGVSAAEDVLRGLGDVSASWL
jgi:glycine/D-amino acid oxidase-like deaminating enzyme